MIKYDTFKQALDNFLLERSFTEELLSRDSEYELLEQRQAGVYELLEEDSPDAAKDCRENHDRLTAIAIEKSYRQGFIEGVKFMFHTLLIE